MCQKTVKNINLTQNPTKQIDADTPDMYQTPLVWRSRTGIIPVPVPIPSYRNSSIPLKGLIDSDSEVNGS